MIVAPLPVAAVPDATAIAQIELAETGQPTAAAVTPGCYVPMSPAPGQSIDLPARWVDHHVSGDRVAVASWIGIGWRDDATGNDAHLTLNRLINPRHTRPVHRSVNWYQLMLSLAAADPYALTVAALTGGLPAAGYTTPEHAAVIDINGLIRATSATENPALTDLETVLAQDPPTTWNTDLHPGAAGGGLAGWNLRLDR